MKNATIMDWNEFNAKFEEKFGFKFHSTADFHNRALEMNHRPNWFRLSDDCLEMEEEDILAALNDLEPISGDLIVVNFASYMEGYGPYSLNSENLEEFSMEHSITLEPFFMSDVFIFNLEQLKVWIFHHECAYDYFDWKNMKASKKV